MRRQRRGGDRDDLLPLLVAARRRRSRGRPRRRWVLPLALTAVLTAAVLAAVAVATAAGVRRALTNCTLADLHARPLPRTSVVYAADGTYLGAIHAEAYRRPVRYDAISPWVKRATVAVEDRTFWGNSGIDVSSIARAALADVRAGHVVEGASTITQQLVRGMFLDDARTFARKREEACLAIKLTHAWSKRRILTTYLNRVPYGNRVLGVDAAAQTYFSIHADRLGPAQAALLAGLPQAPSRYDPFRHPDAALQRRNAVLRAMRRSGMLSAPEYERLAGKPLGLHPGNVYRVHREPNFFAYVREQLVQAYGERRVREGGLHVYTTVLPRDQRAANAAIRRVLDRPHDPAAAVVSIDPRSGAIRALAALVHGRRLKFNLASDGRRQAGSAFKTFVLTDAILHGANPYATRYKSAPFTYVAGPGAKPWTPHTYENEFFGPENLVTATLLSDNVVYAKLTLDLGPASVAHVARELGIRSPLKPVASIGLGSNSVSPLEVASAYASLADGGVYRRPYAIRKVVLPDGRVDRAHSWGPAKPRRAVPRAVAYWVTRVLELNVERGTGTNARLARPAAGKTGTTSDWTDAWFAGYTRRRATAVWMGYPGRTASMSDVHGIHVTGGSLPAEIWSRFEQRALAGKKPLPWLSPVTGWTWKPWRGHRRYTGR